ncbi:MAG: MarR family transcriptional regulator [Ilumatobacter sp.]|nr:MarR family transcriptional regulator [Ilumatobacter sp.]
MGHASTSAFRVLHAVRIKGFATAATLADITALDEAEVQQHLDACAQDGYVQFREARGLWQLTPDGRAAHATDLAVDVAGLDAATLAAPYARFLALNTEFKTLCGDWQLRNGEPNDHADSGYDAAVIDRLGDLHDRAHPIASDIATTIDRFGPYPDRLAAALGRVRHGESNMFTGVMCGSYHDVWMELHEDLILTQGIDRTAEGSF